MDERTASTADSVVAPELDNPHATHWGNAATGVQLCAKCARATDTCAVAAAHVAGLVRLFYYQVQLSQGSSLPHFLSFSFFLPVLMRHYICNPPVLFFLS